jgi:RHS repeat-associated protein
VTGSSPTGTITFKDGATTLGTGTLTAGSASLSYTFNTAGAHSITAEYAGDANNASSTSAASVLTVNKVDSITSLNVTPNPAKPLEPVTMTATVIGFNPTGTVNFMSGLTLLGTSPVNAGVATLSTSFTDAGMRPVTAVYSGDPVNTSSNLIVVELNVNKVASTTSLSVTPSPARPGEPVTMTATVTGFNPTGVVSFMEGGYVIGGAVVNGGVATFNTTFPAAGSYVITALYGADTVNEASYSTPVVITINTGVAQAYFIHSDHLNTPRTITDTSGAVVWQWDNSDPFGNNAANENPGGAGRFNFPLRFPGQYFDKETNTHYNINRDYDPSIGRYIESDPIGLEGGINTFGYVEGNSLSYIDPLGLAVGVGPCRLCLPLPGITPPKPSDPDDGDALDPPPEPNPGLALPTFPFPKFFPNWMKSGQQCKEEEKEKEKDCEDQYDRDMKECRLYSGMTGEKYTFVACKKAAERRLSQCMSEI